MAIYRVKKGDNLWDLARRYNTTWQNIAKQNNISNPRALQIGQQLNIGGSSGGSSGGSGGTYTLRKGDNLWDLANRFGTTWQTLRDLNNIGNHYAIPVGTTIKLPGSNTSTNKTTTTKKTTNNNTKKTTTPKETKPNFIQETQNAGYSETGIDLPYQATDLNSLLAQSQEMLNPLLQQQKNTLQSSYNQEMQNLDNTWASRGLLASGIAATQQSDMAQQLANQMTAVDAEGQALALENAYQLGNFQENQRQFDLGYALEEGALTGNYLPAGTRQLLNDFVSQRAIVEDKDTSDAERREASVRLNDIRRALNTMGVATNDLGRNSSLNDILKSISTGRMGTPTQAAREFEQNFQQREDQFDREMTLREESAEWDREYQSRVQDFAEEQARIDNDLRARGINLEQARVDLQRATFDNDWTYKQHLMDMELSTEEARKATSQAMAEALGKSTPEAAYQWLMENATNFYNDGVNTAEVWNALRSKFGMIMDQIGSGSGSEGGFLGG